jgi:hypothetical protein
MNQMKLITDSRDEWTLKELVETLHAKVDDLERKLDAQLKLNDSIQWHLHAIVLHLTGDRAALTAFVMASEPTVVPNEDEAMPVLASCPQCDTKAYTEAGIADFFGWRTMADGKTIVQSWCRECRSLEGKTNPRKRNKATLWSKMDAQACAFAKAYTQARNEMMQYKVKLDNESLAPSVRAHLQTKYETKRLEQAAHKSEYNKRVAVLQASLTK